MKARELHNACKEFDALQEEEKSLTKTLQVGLVQALCFFE